jgi:hypothetical protein
MKTLRNFITVGGSQFIEPDDDFFELTVDDAKIIQVRMFLFDYYNPWKINISFVIKF